MQSKNLKKNVTLTAAATLAVAAGAATTVHVDAATTDTAAPTDTQQTNATQSSLKQAQDQSRQDYADAKQANTDAQSNLADATAANTQAQGDLANASQAASDAQQAVSDATQQASDAQTALDAAQKAADQVAADPNAEQNAQSAVDDATKNNDSAQADLTSASAAQSQAATEADQADTQAKTAQDSLDQAEVAQSTAQDRLDTAQSDVKNAQDHEQALSDAQKAVDDATTTKSAADQTVSDAQSDVDAKTSANTTAQDSLKSAQDALDQLQNGQTIVNTITATDEWIKDAAAMLKDQSKYINGSTINKDNNSTEFNRFQQEGFNSEKLNTYKDDPAAEAIPVTLTSDGHLSVEDATYASQYAAALINHIRKQVGAPQTIVTTGAVQMATDNVIEDYKDKWNNWDKGHNNNALDVVSKKWLGTSDQFSEAWAGDMSFAKETFIGSPDMTNDVWQASFDGLTRNDLQHGIYDSIVALLFEDSASAYGHTLSILGSGLNGGSLSKEGAQADQLGVQYDYDTTDYTTSGFYGQKNLHGGGFHFNMAPLTTIAGAGADALVNQPQYQTPLGLTDSQDTTEVESAKTAYQKAIQDITEYCATHKYGLSAIDENMYNKEKQAIADGTAGDWADTYQRDIDTYDQVQALKTAANDASNQLADVYAASSSSDLVSKINTAKQAVATAQSKADDASTALQTAQTKLADAKTAQSQAADTLTKAQDNLASLQKDTMDLATAQANLKTAQANKDQADQLVASATQALSDAQTAKDKADAALQTANDNLKTAQDKADATAKTLKDAQAELDAIKNAKADADKALTDAQDKANAANEALQAAQSKADTTASDLKKAQDAADQAQKALADAQTKADAAQAAFDKAKANLISDDKVYGDSVAINPITDVHVGDALPTPTLANPTKADPTQSLVLASFLEVASSSLDPVPTGTTVAWANAEAVKNDMTTPGAYDEDVLVTFPDGSSVTKPVHFNVLAAVTPVQPDPSGDTGHTGTEPGKDNSKTDSHTGQTEDRGENAVKTNGTDGNVVVAKNDTNNGTKFVAANAVALSQSNAITSRTQFDNGKLPQTGNNVNKVMSVLGLGMASVVAMFGFVGINKKRHN
ncbi:SEC10/PgrA surface exclusion domain-containing protein [Limosilactobacillus caecicola]|uniref:SEC10/PgrA surface exclusion domain-containing protein n=1 Tax=Limosilactobacillus caecicola TaxID=2941332 RepID=UPI00203CFEEA|nr:SEC10/PgrA surface exclusion domain-containing protein [Limosilactobacillus caecicola]